MRVLVTGHLGYIGAVLTPLLVAAGHDVVGLDTDLYRACTFGDPGQLAAVPALATDLRDVTVEQLAGFDAVVHLAALSNDPLGDLDPELTYDINHHASVRLARLAREAGARRFLFSSSCSNYGAAGGALLDEDSALNPVTPVRRESRCAPSATSPRSPTEGFSPGLAAQRHGLRRVRRGCASTSSSTTSSPGRTPPARSASRATARRGARSSTSRTSRGPSWRSWPRPQERDPRPGLQRRGDARELPDPRPAADRGAGRARLPRRAGAGRLT